MFSLKPIGFLKSPFIYKNGTPRQPTVCQLARGIISIEKDVFNNPEHSLEGLEEFSHVWIFFIFHKNNNIHTKAKVKPPRLNGKKTGVFSTRSPYRPNNIGLTLAKIENISGASLTVSGIDMLDGTPIIDLKPYIPQYDSPSSSDHFSVEEDEFDVETSTSVAANETSDVLVKENVVARSKPDLRSDKTVFDSDTIETVAKNSEFELNPHDEAASGNESDVNIETCKDNSQLFGATSIEETDEVMGMCKDNSTEQRVLTRLENADDNGKLFEYDSHSVSIKDHFCKSNSNQIADVSKDDEAKTEDDLATANWVIKAPVSQLEVRWTPSAIAQLKLFSCDHSSSDYRLNFLKNCDEAQEAICNILREDPRSTYRRKHCIDHLYYFTFDNIHVTCWFDDNLVEIVRVKPINQVEKLCKRLIED